MSLKLTYLISVFMIQTIGALALADSSDNTKCVLRDPFRANLALTLESTESNGRTAVHELNREIMERKALYTGTSKHVVQLFNDLKCQANSAPCVLTYFNDMSDVRYGYGAYLSVAGLTVDHGHITSNNPLTLQLFQVAQKELVKAGVCSRFVERDIRWAKPIPVGD